MMNGKNKAYNLSKVNISPMQEIFILIGDVWKFYRQNPKDSKTDGQGTAWELLAQNLHADPKEPPILLDSRNLTIETVKNWQIVPNGHKCASIVDTSGFFKEKSKSAQGVIIRQNQQILTALCEHLAINSAVEILLLRDNLGQELENLSGYIKRLRADHSVTISSPTISNEIKKEPYIEYREKNGLKGLYFIIPKVDKETGEVIRENENWICDKLELLGEGFEGNRAFYVFQFTHPDTKKPVIEPLSFSEFGSKSGWDRLADLGLKMTAKTNLTAYLVEHFHRKSSIENLARYDITTQTGWQNVAYLLPNGEILGNETNKVLFKFKNLNEEENHYKPKGTLDQWREQIADKVKGNWGFMLSMAVSFSAPLLKILNLDSFGVHIYNDSSKGKTTAIYVANSIWGNPKGILRSWNNTENAILGYAEQQNDGFLSLDELGQAKDIKELEKIAYSLFNEMGRGRLTKELAKKAVKRWKITALSTGERSLEDFLQSKGAKIHTGQLVRLLNIPTSEIEQLNGFKSPKEQAEHLKEQALENYGAVGREWVAFIMTHKEQIKAEYKINRQKWGSKTETHSSQVQRVAADRFSILETALNMAQAFTGWSKEENEKAINRAFSEWLAVFGERSKTETKIIERINGFLLENAETAFFQVVGGSVSNKEVRGSMGYRFLADNASDRSREHFYIFSHSFKNQLKSDDDLNIILKTLESVKMTEKSNEQKYPYLHKLSAKLDRNRPRCYLVYRLDESADETEDKNEE